MKLIYHEEVRKDYQSPYKRVDVFYPVYPEPDGMPPLIHIVTGKGDQEDDTVNQWYMIHFTEGGVPSEAKTIRKAITMIDKVETK